MTFVHETVLREEATQLLKPGSGKVFIDGTIGGGGHAESLLQRGAVVFGVDKDPRALAAAKERLAPYGEAFRPVRGGLRPAGFAAGRDGSASGGRSAVGFGRLLSAAG